MNEDNQTPNPNETKRTSLITIRRGSAAHTGLKVAAVGLMAFVVLYLLPQTYDDYLVNRFSRMAIFALVALGLGLLTGFNGQISLCHSAFFGLGAYTAAVLAADHGWSLFATVPAAAVLAFVVGVLVGLPALRIKGIYLALVTLALASVFPQLIKRLDSLTGGSQGKRAPKLKAPDWTGLADAQWRYYVVIVVVIVLFVLARNIVHSRMGRAMVAIRDNETAAEVSGVNVARVKLTTFGISAAMAGIAGALSVMVDNFVSPDAYPISKSIEYLAGLALGGAATLIGPVIGSVFLIQVPEWLKAYNKQLSVVFFGMVLIVVMIILPSGIAGLVSRIRRRIITFTD